MSAVTLFHEKSGRTMRASRAAYDEVWSKEGDLEGRWVIQDEPEESEQAKPARRGRKPAGDSQGE